MGKWNYNVEGPVENGFRYANYTKQHVEIKARGKRSGITFELRDAFLELEKKGLLIDVNKDGFTKKDALNLYNELNKIHKERKLDINYTQMKEHSKFDYTEEEVRRLANAAGYETKKIADKRYICQTDHTGVAPLTTKQSIDFKNKNHKA